MLVNGNSFYQVSKLVLHRVNLNGFDLLSVLESESNFSIAYLKLERASSRV